MKIIDWLIVIDMILSCLDGVPAKLSVPRIVILPQYQKAPPSYGGDECPSADGLGLLGHHVGYPTVAVRGISRVPYGTRLAMYCMVLGSLSIE